MKSSLFLPLCCALALSVCSTLAAQTPPANPVNPANLGESEVLKCEEKIASVRRDVLGKYEDALGELQLSLQKAADLEGALAVRAERSRLAQEHTLFERNYVTEPKALRAVQSQYVAKMQELVSQIVADALPKLVELKKSMTMAGKLDEALAVRTAIEKLQNSNVPVAKPDAGSVVPAETLLLAYASDRVRADKTYKAQRIIVRGTIGGYRQDPADTRFFHVYLTGGNSGTWVQCAFSAADFRFREEKSAFGAMTLIVTTKDGEPVARIQKGQNMDIRGVCEGMDEVVRLGRCDVPRQ
jgi:hypothetical protein